MRKQYAVIGLGRFGASVAKTLSELGHDVLAIDSSDLAVQGVVNFVTHAVQVDAREEETLRSLGIRNFEVVIVAIGNDIEASILITLMLKEMGIRFVVCKAMTPLHGKVLEKVGADKVVFPEKDMGVRLARSLITSNVMDYIELTSEYSLLEILTPSKFVDKNLGELNLRAHYEISVMAIKRDNAIIVAPGADTHLEKKDVLILVCKNETLDKLPLE